MSLKSMTGYGRGTARGGGMFISVELSSVNRKSFESRISMPDEMHSLRSVVDSGLREAVSRGAVSCQVDLEWAKRIRRKSVSIDEDLARGYVETIQAVARKLGMSEKLPAQSLLELPGVVEFGAPEVDMDEMEGLLEKALATALKRLNTMRKREGRRLQRDISERVKDLKDMAASIRERAPIAFEKHRDALFERLREAGLKSGGDADQRIEREVVLFADKADIEEELTRLDSHFDQAWQIISSEKPAGRALDFLAQEFLREINTIASKSADAGISRLAVEFKSELERVREQVRNVE